MTTGVFPYNVGIVGDDMLSENKVFASSFQKKGFDAFGCTVPQSLVLHCKEFIKNNEEWDRTLMAEICWETVNMIAHDKGDNV